MAFPLAQLLPSLPAWLAPRQWRRLAAWRTPRLLIARRVSALVPGLQQSRRDLLRFGKESDREFTALAQGLAQLDSRITEVRTQTHELDLVLHDRDEDHALSSAYAQYKNSVDLVHATMGIALSEQEQMDHVVKNLQQACAVHAKFVQTNMMFRVLTMSIRMEAARVDPEYQGIFINVASAIAEIEQKISATTESAFNRIEHVVQETVSERGQLQHTQEDLHTRAQSSIGMINRELDNVKDALSPCLNLSQSIGALLDRTKPLTLRVLTSLQYQDIVRQKLEHVATGLDEMCTQINRNAKGQGTVDWGYLHHATRVQQAQLHSARTEIEQAGLEVTSGLNDLLAISEELVNRFTEMEQAAADAFLSCRVADMFREEIGKLARIADQSEQTNCNISRLVERIETVVSVFSQEISQHEFEVKLVALNAQISAARLPSADALNRLAEETSRVAAENATVTNELTAELQATLKNLRKIKTEADDFLALIKREKADLERGALVVSAKLERLSQRIQQNSTQVSKNFSTAHETSRALLEGLAFPQEIGACFGPGQELCESLLATTAGFASQEDLSAEAIGRLEAHQEHYTMREEHAAHAAALGQASQPSAAPASMEIELFDNPVARDPTELATPAEPAAEKKPEATTAAAEPPPPAPPATPPPAEAAPETKTNKPPAKDEFGPGIDLF
ncbi:MAG: methyl-accepting chemotaxis protein [Opitutae bacterium]|nr:methyl-accepting chemotaxis protein [Opitutae bacterium]